MVQHRNAGFTLVELSIVLVIIGLIVAGVLVGQDLIKAAETRATVTQFEQFNSALNTFRTKYSYLPGDVRYTKAAAFGLTQGPDPAVGNGDGSFQGWDGTDVLASTAANAANGAGERSLFWHHLSQAGLVGGAVYDGSQAVSASNEVTFPVAKTGFNVGIGIYSVVNTHYYHVGINGTDGSRDYVHNYAMDASAAYNIDNKIDDGLPLDGIVMAQENINTNETGYATASTDAECVFDANGTSSANSGDEYNVGHEGAVCAIRIKVMN